MPAEQISKDQSLWKGILTGAASCLAAVILLLPAAVLMEKNKIGTEYEKLLPLLCLFFAAFLCSAYICRQGRGVTVPVSALTVMLILLLFEASMKTVRLSVSSVLPAVLIESAGVCMGMLLKRRKNDVRKRKPKKNITNRNRKRSFT